MFPKYRSAHASAFGHMVLQLLFVLLLFYMMSVGSHRAWWTDPHVPILLSHGFGEASNSSDNLHDGNCLLHCHCTGVRLMWRCFTSKLGKNDLTIATSTSARYICILIMVRALTKDESPCVCKPTIIGTGQHIWLENCCALWMTWSDCLPSSVR